MIYVHHVIACSCFNCEGLFSRTTDNSFIISPFFSYLSDHGLIFFHLVGLFEAPGVEGDDRRAKHLGRSLHARVDRYEYFNLQILSLFFFCFFLFTFHGCAVFSNDLTQRT